jgi:hypothetical protein
MLRDKIKNNKKEKARDFATKADKWDKYDNAHKKIRNINRIKIGLESNKPVSGALVCYMSLHIQSGVGYSQNSMQSYISL